MPSSYQSEQFFSRARRIASLCTNFDSLFRLSSVGMMRGQEIIRVVVAVLLLEVDNVVVAVFATGVHLIRSPGCNSTKFFSAIRS